MSSSNNLQASMAFSTLTPSAMQRLQKDIREMEKEPLPGIQVHFDASNLALMCLLLTPQEGPYLGICLHLSVHIPSAYPLQPPQVSIQTPIEHPNVSGSYICCDLLEYGVHRRLDSYAGGYTPAYLLKYLFLQLLSFFSAARIEQDDGGFLCLDGHPYLLPYRARLFSCKKCAFDSTHSWPCPSSRPSTSTSRISTESTHRVVKSMSQVNLADVCEGEDHLDMLHDHVWLLIFDHLSDQDLVSLARASPQRAGDVLRRYNVSLRRELVCFFSRKTFKEAVLGVGVLLLTDSRKSALLVEAFDLLSLEAFEKQHVRDGVCGHRFTHFLALALDDDHFVRAIPSFRNFLMAVNPLDTSPVGFLCVIPKLMNLMIVNMMKVCDEHVGDMCEAKRAILQASEKAFKGYCLLFHLLLKLSTRFPLIRTRADEKLAVFLSNKQARNKRTIPDLGEFVAMLPLALKEGYSWGSLSAALVEELLTRNVLWVLRVKPELEKWEGISERGKRCCIDARQHRFEGTFSASRTGLRLMMLQANFMRALVQSRDKLSETYGFPSDAMAGRLVDLVKRIYTVGEGREPYQKGYGAWKDFFNVLHFRPVPDEAQTEEMLRTAIHDSESKGYHDINHIRQGLSASSGSKYSTTHPSNLHKAARHNATRR